MQVLILCTNQVTNAQYTSYNSKACATSYFYMHLYVYLDCSRAHVRSNSFKYPSSQMHSFVFVHDIKWFKRISLNLFFKLNLSLTPSHLSFAQIHKYESKKTDRLIATSSENSEMISHIELNEKKK